MRDHEVGDRGDIVKRDERHREAGKLAVARDRDDEGIFEAEQCLAEAGPVHLELWVRMSLEPLDEKEIDRRHMLDELFERRLRRAAMLVHQCPTIGRADHDLARTRLAVCPTILAWLIDVEAMMRVLQRRHSQTTAD